MEKIIIMLLAGIFMFPVVTVAKEKKAKMQNKMKLIINQQSDSTGSRTFYGIKHKRKTLLKPKYNLRHNHDVRIFVFYTDEEVYVVDEFGSTLYHEIFDDEEHAYTEVLIEPVKIREDVQCYEVNMYFFDGTYLMMQRLGTYFYQDGHLYEIETQPRILQKY